ncbi:hypothetical protein ACHAXH_008101 [Discostella pseudostelligera]|jgi:ribosomal protein S18 acetylase RimI-like enzyme
MRVAAFAFAVALCGNATSFSCRSSLSTRHRPSFMSVTNSNTAVESTVQILNGDEQSIANAAKFMVDAFWLQSPQQLIQQDGWDVSELSEMARSSLIQIQAEDLESKYGERMGKRKLDSLIIATLDSGNINNDQSSLSSMLGMVTLEVRLMDRQQDFLSIEASERMLTQAVATLGPKQRREFKDASVIDTANQLLSPDITAVCTLSNLCVSPMARRQGLAAKLCNEAERIARDVFGFSDIYLRVELANDAAKRLYEEKLCYESVFDVNSTTTLRVDGIAGCFVEVDTDMLVMRKKLR